MKSEGSCHPGCLGQFTEQSQKSHWKIPQPDKQGLWNGFSSYKEVTWPRNTKNQVNPKFYTYENSNKGPPMSLPCTRISWVLSLPILPSSLPFTSSYSPPISISSTLTTHTVPLLRLFSKSNGTHPSCPSCPTLIASFKALQHSVPKTVFQFSDSILLYNPNWLHP